MEGSGITGPPRSNPVVGHIVQRLFNLVHPPSVGIVMYMAVIGLTDWDVFSQTLVVISPVHIGILCCISSRRHLARICDILHEFPNGSDLV